MTAPDDDEPPHALVVSPRHLPANIRVERTAAVEVAPTDIGDGPYRMTSARVARTPGSLTITTGTSAFRRKAIYAGLVVPGVAIAIATGGMPSIVLFALIATLGLIAVVRDSSMLRTSRLELTSGELRADPDGAPPRRVPRADIERFEYAQDAEVAPRDRVLSVVPRWAVYAVADGERIRLADFAFGPDAAMAVALLTEELATQR